jgi:hypothetical protein
LGLWFHTFSYDLLILQIIWMCVIVICVILHVLNQMLML